MLYRASALLLVILWMAMPLAAVAHVELEQHNYCAEHQTIEHGQSGHSADESDVPKHSRLTRRGDPPLKHENCSFAEDCLRYSKAEPVDVAGTMVNSLQGSSTIESQTLIALIAVLYSAPKNSPPSLFA